MKYQSTKTYGNDRGLSCCFRQWRADSHCNLIHGYSLGFRFVFEADVLDDRNWVYDFGNCKWIKEFLEENFDHTLVISSDDPRLGKFKELNDTGLARLKVIHGVGCEKFSEFVYQYVSPIVIKQTLERVRLKSVEVFEHGANSAIYLG
tara:strand:- start:35 stop:478 length:444 start_codon:yes stop_codon:yes gene_type:complete